MNAAQNRERHMSLRFIPSSGQLCSSTSSSNFDDGNNLKKVRNISILSKNSVFFTNKIKTNEIMVYVRSDEFIFSTMFATETEE